MKLEDLESVGEAWSWELETVQAFDWSDLGMDSYYVKVRAEVPYTKDHHRIPRRGNRYWPTLIDLETGLFRHGEEITVMLMVEDARSLAAALNKAADVAEQTDKPDLDACGHWWPCNGCKP